MRRKCRFSVGERALSEYHERKCSSWRLVTIHWLLCINIEVTCCTGKVDEHVQATYCCFAVHIIPASRRLRGAQGVGTRRIEFQPLLRQRSAAVRRVDGNVSALRCRCRCLGATILLCGDTSICALSLTRGNAINNLRLYIYDVLMIATAFYISVCAAAAPLAEHRTSSLARGASCRRSTSGIRVCE